MRFDFLLVNYWIIAQWKWNQNHEINRILDRTSDENGDSTIVDGQSVESAATRITLDFFPHYLSFYVSHATRCNVWIAFCSIITRSSISSSVNINVSNAKNDIANRHRNGNWLSARYRYTLKTRFISFSHVCPNCTVHVFTAGADFLPRAPKDLFTTRFYCAFELSNWLFFSFSRQNRRGAQGMVNKFALNALQANVVQNLVYTLHTYVL